MSLSQSSPLINILNGHIVHCTSPTNYKLICEDGYIRPNKNNTYPFTWNQTLGSCVYELEGISLLDFGLNTDKIFFEEDQEDFRYSWESILTAHYPETIIIKINRKKIINKILDWETIREKTENCSLIPYIEVCTLYPIPISMFDGVVRIKQFSDFTDVNKGYCSKYFLATI